MIRLRKIVPAPLSSAALLGLWMMLARSASLGHIILGVSLALTVPLITANLRPTQVHVRKPRTILRFVLTIIRDVVVSNLQIAWGVVAWRWRRPQTRFVTVPLELRDPLGLAVLSMVTTIVPGTVWSELALDRSALLLHVWDVAEEEAFVAHFKARYEHPLREIFE